MTTVMTDFRGTEEVPLTSVPSGWTKYGTWDRRTALGGRIRGASFGQMVFNTYASGLRTISSTMYWGSAGASSEWGLGYLNSSRTGFSVLIKNASITIRKEVAGAPGSTISTTAATNTADAVFSVDFDDSTGEITVKKAGSSVLTGSYTDTATLYPAFQSYNSGTAQTFSTVTVNYAGTQTVTSINGGVAFTATQTTSSAVTTGFTGLPSTITATWGAYSIPITSIGGSTNAPTFTKAVRVDGSVYPKSGEVLTLTFTKSLETESGTQTFNKDSDEVELAVTSPIIDDPKYLFGAIYAAAGRTAVTGDYGYYKVPVGMSDLTIGVDGRIQSTNAGTFQYWAYTAATGVNYYYSVTITENGVVIGVGLTSAGLTVSGLTSSGL